MIEFKILLTKHEMEVVSEMTPLHDGSIEGAITNGIIKQIINQEGEDNDR